MRMLRLLLLLVLLAVWGLLFSPAGRPAAAQGQNLLVNPSFEGQYSAYVPETPQEAADCPVGICNTAQVPAGWKPWWVKERSSDSNPEYKPAEPNVAANRIRSGERAAQYFSFWRTHKAGLRQTLTVPANARVQFAVWGMAWMSESDSALSSDPGATPNMRIGIDPTGGTNPYSAAIVWSGFQQPLDVYALFSVEAQAQGTTVTVFTFSAPDPNPYNAEFGLKHNDIYWDDASLAVVGAGSPPPPPPPAPSGGNSGSGATAPAPVAPSSATLPTATPNAEGIIYAEVQPGDSMWSIAARAGLTLDELLELNNLSRDDFIQAGQLLIIGRGDPPGAEPTAEPTQEAEPTEAPPTPTPRPTATPGGIARVEQESGASICLKAFDDANKNGQQDSGEALRAAVAFTISDGESVVSNYVTDGESEPFCIQGLDAGSYRVARSSAGNEVMTTPGDQSVSVTEGSVLNLEFGSYASQDAIAADVATETSAAPATNNLADTVGENSDDDGSPWGTVVIIAVGVAVLLLVGVLVVILSVRRAAG